MSGAVLPSQFKGLHDDFANFTSHLTRLVKDAVVEKSSIFAGTSPWFFKIAFPDIKELAGIELVVPLSRKNWPVNNSDIFKCIRTIYPEIALPTFHGSSSHVQIYFNGRKLEETNHDLQDLANAATFELRYLPLNHWNPPVELNQSNTSQPGSAAAAHECVANAATMTVNPTPPPPPELWGWDDPRWNEVDWPDWEDDDPRWDSDTDFAAAAPVYWAQQEAARVAGEATRAAAAEQAAADAMMRAEDARAAGRAQAARDEAARQEQARRNAAARVPPAPHGMMWRVYSNGDMELVTNPSYTVQPNGGNSYSYGGKRPQLKNGNKRQKNKSNTKKARSKPRCKSRSKLSKRKKPRSYTR